METKIMNIMKSFLFLLIAVSTISCNFMNGQNTLAVDKKIQSQRTRLKNLAFCQCQSQVDSNTYKLNDSSAAGFMAYMAYEEGINIDLQDFTVKWLKKNEKTYTSYSESLLTNMKCLDYYNSKELESFIIKQDGKINKEILKEIPPDK
jgi:hypothetical protein